MGRKGGTVRQNWLRGLGLLVRAEGGARIIICGWPGSHERGGTAAVPWPFPKKGNDVERTGIGA